MKKNSIIVLFILFICFLWLETSEKSTYAVLEVVSPTEIIVDINDNGIKDDNELVLVENIQSFSSKPSEYQSQLVKELKISEEDAMGLGFLAESFAKEKLIEKRVSLDGSIIFVDNQDYKKLLLDSGLALRQKWARTPEFENNLKKIRKLNLRIFNENSHKYHKLNCKYGLIAHNSEILPQSQLPKDAKPCKFCLVKHEVWQKAKGKGQKVSADNFIPNIAQAPTILVNGAVKVFLTDLTTRFKPSSDCSTPVCKALVDEINRSQNSIDFAIYGYTKIPKLQQALENAQKRGVKIRFVYDIDGKNGNLYPDTLYLTGVLKNNRGDYASSRKNQSAIMHDKFFIFDNKTVLTGSANISNTDMSGFNSNVIVLIKSPQIADLYEQEFEQMFEGYFHTKKRKIGENEHLDFNNSDYSIYFSPEERVITEKVIPLIDGAKEYIYMPVFLITHKALAQSLIRASKRGVAVKVILDATNAHGAYSAHKLLRENGIQVKTENFAGKLHSKSIIIDDIYTIIGSMNFSRSGENINDENMIIIENREIALFYKTFFQYLWKRIPDKWLKLNARAESPDSIGSCNDGIDNDFDEKIDKADDSCRIR